MICGSWECSLRTCLVFPLSWLAMESFTSGIIFVGKWDYSDMRNCWTCCVFMTCEISTAVQIKESLLLFVMQGSSSEASTSMLHWESLLFVSQRRIIHNWNSKQKENNRLIDSEKRILNFLRYIWLLFASTFKISFQGCTEVIHFRMFWFLRNSLCS
jgi:hypothetical protein